MASPKIYTKSEIEAIIQALEHYFPFELGDTTGPRSVDGKWTDLSKTFSWRNKDDFFTVLSEITGVQNLSAQEIKLASRILEGMKSTAPTTEFKGAEEGLDQTLPNKEVISKEAIEKNEQRIVETKATTEKFNQEVRTSIKRHQEICAQEVQKAKVLETKLKGQKIYVKVNEGQKTQEAINLEAQASANPKKFVGDATKQFATNPALKNLSPAEARIATEQAAVTTYDVLSGNSPIIQTAIINKVVSDPTLLNKFIPNLNDQNTLKSLASILTNQKMSQLELSKQFLNFAKIDGFERINDVNVEFSYTPQSGFKEFDLNNQIVTPGISGLNQQNIFLDNLRGLGEGEVKSQALTFAGGRLESYIATLPTNSLLAQTYNSEIVQLGLSSIGFVEAVPMVAVEGSVFGKIVIGSGLGPLAGFVQSKTGINLGIKVAEKAGEKVLEKSVQLGAEAGTKAATGSGIFAGLTAALTPVLGPLAPVASAIISWVGSDLIIKTIKKIGSIIPWKKVKEWSAAIVGGLSGLIALPLIGLGGAIGIGAGVTGIAAAFGGGLGGLTFARVGSGILGFFSALGAATLGAIGTPILVTLIGFPVVVVFILFIINSGAYVVPPSTYLSTIGADNPYLLVTKTANPPKIDNNGSKKVEYTVSITALKSPLTNVKIVSTKCTISKKSGGSVNCPPEKIPPLPPGVSVSPSSPYTFSFTGDYSQGLTDAFIYDSITVSADSQDKKGISTTGSAGVCIGDCAVKCLKASDNGDKWPGNLRSNIESATIGLGSNNPKFVGMVCQGETEINLCYKPSAIGAGFYAWHIHNKNGDNCDVYFNEKGVSSTNDALFMITHELTHHIQNKNGSSISEYEASGGFAEVKANGFCSYKNTRGNSEESMAEASGLFAAIPSWGSCVQNYKNNYPLNYMFAQKFMK